jgi:hypothetical protein
LKGNLGSNKTYQFHAPLMPSNGAPGLFEQEYHHGYLGAVFSLFHQAEKISQCVKRNKE